jgi:NAD(P)-dependent dehydrogenase (short-subunit alcohol dehydrogenase family)
MDYDNLEPRHGPARPGARRAARAAPTRPSRRMSRLAFITGASSGIGQALAWRYYQAGWSLALVARRTGEIQQWARAQGIPRALAASTPRTWRTPTASSRRARQCLATQGLPDVVIANAGISVGVDTAVREDLDVIARTFATNNVGLAATFHPFVAAMWRAAAARWWASAASPASAACRGTAPTARARRRSSATARACAASCAQRREGGDDRPGYIDTPLTRQNRYGMPFLMKPRTSPSGVPHHRSRHELPRDPVADGRGRQAAAACCPMRCSTGVLAGRRASTARASERGRSAGHGRPETKKAPGSLLSLLHPALQDAQ